MKCKFRCATQAILIMFLLLSSVAAQQTQQDCDEWYAYCPDCAKYLGGNGVAGPYPNKNLCLEYVKKMQADGFRFIDNDTEPCKCDKSGQQAAQPQLTPKQARRIVISMGVGAASGCAIGAVVAGKTDSGDQLGGCLAGSAIGALTGFFVDRVVIGYFAPPNPSPLTRRRSRQMDSFGISVTVRF